MLKKIVRSALILTCVLTTSAVLAQNAPDADTTAPDPDADRCVSETKAFSTAQWRQKVICSINGPAQVQAYRVRCSGASYLDYQIADCCVPGDHWQLKGKNWDSAPQTTVTTSPGPAGTYGLPARLYNYGGTPQNPGNMDAFIECSYLHGVDLFGAGSYIALSSDGSCSVTAVGGSSRIDRAP